MPGSPAVDHGRNVREAVCPSVMPMGSVRPGAAGRQRDENCSRAVARTNKKPATKAGLSPCVTDCCLRLRAAARPARPARPRLRRVPRLARRQIRPGHRGVASSDGRRLADRVPSHPHPIDRHRNRRRGEIKLTSRSKKRRGMRSRLECPHRGHLSGPFPVEDSMRSGYGSA